MSELWVVVPAAGDSRRFKDAGYDIPKPLLKVKSKLGIIRYMMEHALVPTLFLDGHREGPIVGLPWDSNPPATGLNYRRIGKTLGQADTVLQLIKNLPEDDHVLVLDCDMVLQQKDIEMLVALITVGNEYDVAIAVTKTFDPNASRVDSIPWPTRFVEKEPISEYGIVGARAFKDIGTLRYALEKTLTLYKNIGKEPYLSVAINHYPGTKYAHLISEYTDWGTPQRIKESGAEIVS
jgi:NDP-sugar pyrophosphorylase family protein